MLRSFKPLLSRPARQVVEDMLGLSALVVLLVAGLNFTALV